MARHILRSIANALSMVVMYKRYHGPVRGWRVRFLGILVDWYTGYGIDIYLYWSQYLCPPRRIYMSKRVEAQFHPRGVFLE